MLRAAFLKLCGVGTREEGVLAAFSRPASKRAIASGLTNAQLLFHELVRE